MLSLLVLGSATPLATKFMDVLLHMRLDEVRKPTSEFKLYATDTPSHTQSVINFRKGFLENYGLEDFGLRILPLLFPFKEGDDESAGKIARKISPPPLSGVVLFSRETVKAKCKDSYTTLTTNLNHLFEINMPLVVVTSTQIGSGSFNREEPTGVSFRHLLDLPNSRNETVTEILSHLFPPKA